MDETDSGRRRGNAPAASATHDDADDVNAPPITGPIVADDNKNGAAAAGSAADASAGGGSKVWRREGTLHQQDSSSSGEQLATTKRLLNGGAGGGYPLGAGIIIGEDALELIVILCLLGLLVGSLVTSTFLYCRRRAVGRRRGGRADGGAANEADENKSGDHVLMTTATATADHHLHQHSTFSESLL